MQENENSKNPSDAKASEGFLHTTVCAVLFNSH